MDGSAVMDPDVLVDGLVDVIDELRGDLHPEFGVRAFHASTVLRTWSGAIVGDGTPVDVVHELTPQPKVETFDGFRYMLLPQGIAEAGNIRLKEVSLTYIFAELAGPVLAANQQWFIKLTEALGQLQPPRYYVLSQPPYPDRLKDMGWVIYLRYATPGGTEEAA